MTNEHATHVVYRLLEREAGGNPWVLSAILEREIIVDKVVDSVENFGADSVSDELRDAYLHAVHEVDFRKELTGISDPEPYPVLTDKT